MMGQIYKHKLVNRLLCGSFGNGADILLDLEDEKRRQSARLLICRKYPRYPHGVHKILLSQPVDGAEVVEVFHGFTALIITTRGKFIFEEPIRRSGEILCC